MTVTEQSRHELLERYGRWYGEERFAITFTATNAGADSKRVTTPGWETTRPLANPDQAAGLIAARGAKANIAIVLRPSNLVVLECDTEDDLLAIQQWALPATITVRSSEPYKRHFYYRPAPELERLPYVAFRFESGKLTADAGRYFLAPPSIHPSGAVYSFLPDHGPDDVDVAELPEDVYRDLADHARESDRQTREHLHLDPDAKVPPGNRRESIFRYASALRRWSANRNEILEAAQRWNELHCDPPVTPEQVAMQVDGAMKMQGGQDLERAIEEPVDPGPEWEQHPEQENATNAFHLTVRTARQIDADPDPPASDTLLGPFITRGERTIIVGDTGHGKTTLSLQMLAAVLRGDDMLDHEGAGEGPVMVVDLEQGRKAIKRGLREAGLADRDDVLHISVPDGLALDKDKRHVAELERVISESKPVLLLLDPYYKAHRADDSNQERPIVDLMRQLDALRTRHRFSLMLPAHPRKEIVGKEGARKLTLHDVAGSGAVTRGAETVLGIERLAHGFARLRYLKDREGELPIGEHLALFYDKAQGFRIDHREDETDEAIENRIVNTSTDWMTTDEWRKELNIRKQRAITILAKLADSDRIAFMVGPPGRSAKARCYGTSPKCWEQSGTVGNSEQIPIESDTVPTVPPPERGTEWEQSDDATGPGTPDDPNPLLDPDDDIPF